MAWVSLTQDGERIVSEARISGSCIARVDVFTKGGNLAYCRNCKPGDDLFRKLVRAARVHCAK